jgi:short subunit dehydrogenase-like uncharacterized protein
MAVTPAMRRGLLLTRWLGWLLAAPSVRRRLVARAKAGKPGPGDASRAAGESRLWGEARDARGQVAISRLVAPEAYTLTARTAVASARRVLTGGVPLGFQTPSRAFGPDFILEQEGTRREDVA